MTRATELKSRGNVFTPVYGVRTDIPPKVVCALSEGQVSLAWTPAEGVVCLTAAKRGNDNSPSQAALATL